MTPRPGRLHDTAFVQTLISVWAGSVEVHEGIREAQQAVECVTVKLLVTQYTEALKRLISEVQAPAGEARKEIHPSHETGQYFRNELDGAVRRFWVTVGYPEASDTSSYRYGAYGLITEFSEKLCELLPVSERFDAVNRRIGIVNAEPHASDEIWKSRLHAAADAADELAQRLRETQVGRLEEELGKKRELHRGMEASLRRLNEVL